MPEKNKAPNAEKSETKREKFLRMAPKRTNAALDSIRLIGNLQAYESKPEEVKAIFEAIRSAVTDAEKRFAPKTKAERESFSLPS